MRKILAIIFLFLIGAAQVVTSQEFSRKFGKVTLEEFETVTCPIDETTDAMVIHDIGEVYYEPFGNNFKLILNRRFKIKVFSKAGLNYADVTIPFYKSFGEEKISHLKGNVYNLQDGKIVVTKLNTKNAYEEKISENWFRLKFAMPDVKEGSIFEVSYTLTSPYVADIPTWYFQRRIPVLFSEYTVKMNQYYEFKSVLRGVDRCDEFEVIDGHEQIYRFAMKDVQAFKDESFMASEDDYIIRLEFQLAARHYYNQNSVYYTSTWPKLCQELLERDLFGKYLRASERKAKDIIEEWNIDSLNPLEKLKVIERYVKTNFSFDGNNDYFASKNVDEFLTSKTGSCGNLNLFLCGLINAAGINARPVLLSTRDNGQLQTVYPFLTSFNYVIVEAIINDKKMLFDATDPLSNFGVIPVKCINDKGLIVQTEQIEWINLISNEKSTMHYELTLKPDPGNNVILQEGKLRTTGYDAINHRRDYQKDYDELAKRILGVNYKTIDSIQEINILKIEEPFELMFSKSIEMEVIDDKIMIDPFCSLVITENPMKQTSRTYPIDFTYNSSKSYLTTIVIPEGYRLLNKPENMVTNNPFGRIVYTINNDKPNIVTISAQYQFTKTKYDASKYSHLKELYNSVVNKFNEKVVLIKNESSKEI